MGELAWLVEFQVEDVNVVFGIAGYKREVVLKGSSSDDEGMS